ncbi:MAG: DUF2807 domain-containing protein [Cyclobacteriaceae bacterium]|jgi:hypothetical protein|nr:DUF2807 domain-containing protein [Cyclobacteriaceae bacterium]
MSKINKYILFILPFALACNNEHAFDCIKKTGTVKEYNISLSDTFDKINIRTNIDVSIIQGNVQKVKLTTGENLYPKINIRIEGNELFYENDNTCDWAREYGITKLQITTPDLKQIVYEGGGEIRSIGVLEFDTLSLDSKESSGDYFLDIKSNELNVTTKRISNFYISGIVNDLNIDFLTGDGRFCGKDLIAQNVFFYHNGTNDVMVFPIKALEGVIDRYGNLIYYNDPLIKLDVKTLSKGQLISEF